MYTSPVKQINLERHTKHHTRPSEEFSVSTLEVLVMEEKSPDCLTLRTFVEELVTETMEGGDRGNYRVEC